MGYWTIINRMHKQRKVFDYATAIWRQTLIFQHWAVSSWLNLFWCWFCLIMGFDVGWSNLRGINTFDSVECCWWLCEWTMMLWWFMKWFSLFCGQGGWKWRKIGKIEIWMMVERILFISCFSWFWWSLKWSPMELKAIQCDDCFHVIVRESVYGLNFILKSHFFITSD